MTFHTNCLLVQNHWVLGYKIDGFIKIYDEIKYVVLLSFTWFDKILHTYKWKKDITDSSIKHNFAKIRIDSYNSLPMEKILTLLLLC